MRNFKIREDYGTGGSIYEYFTIADNATDDDIRSVVAEITSNGFEDKRRSGLYWGEIPRPNDIVYVDECTENGKVIKNGKKLKVNWTLYYH